MQSQLKSISSQAADDIKRLIPRLSDQELEFIELKIYRACEQSVSVGMAQVMDKAIAVLEGKSNG